MKSHYDMIQWYSSSGLRPYLACLTDEREKEAFLVEYEDLLKGAYPLQKNHKVLLPFTRIFFTVNKQA